MATKKITVTLSVEQIAAIHSLVASHHANSVSAFVQHAVTVSLNDVVGWGALLGHALTKTGGPMTKEERSWADAALGVPRAKKAKGRKKAA